MRILVTYGSTRGGTQGLAQMVADGLRETGCSVDVLPAGQAHTVDGYDAVVVGGALYAFRWHRAARRFVRRHAAALKKRPVYFFSSGPLDDSASKGEIPPVKGVAALMERVGARGHVTFGGRLSQYARGFPASAMSKKVAGDWRDAGQVREWAHTVAHELTESPLPV
ncbi:MAG: flavodoxin domain-containing protein [Streptosporangiaceae bacterium]